MQRVARISFLRLLVGLVAGLLLASSARARERSPCEEDVRFALKALEDKCGHFFELKGVDWKEVSRTFPKEARRVKTPGEHWKLLVRLVARLKDGHAGVRKVGEGQAIEWPEPASGPMAGPGMFWCRVGKKIFVKNCWSAAAELGIAPGMEITKVEGQRVRKWLEARIEERSDVMGFSTDHQALFSACHWGLSQSRGSRLKVEFRDLEGKPRKRTITYRKATTVPQGPAFFPEGLKGDKDVRYGRTKAGWGYVHLRRCPSNLPERMDEALSALDDPSGLIVDLRANGGGGFGHEAFLGRFVPKGKSLAFAKRYVSAGPNPYGGPVVVIVDGLTRSAGETCAAIFKEDGRAYLIGESPTAGMSSSKTTIALPSGLFTLYVSVASNMGRSNRGRGIEGMGIPPHEIVLYDPEDLAQGVDTMIRRAEEYLARPPRGTVPYDPRDFGWRR